MKRIVRNPVANHQSMHLLGISGSPRQASTSFAIQEALNHAAEKWSVGTEYISLRNKKISFCTHCDHCIREKQGCIHKDDMTTIYEEMEKADAYIIGTPVYNGSLSGQLKTLFDRCRAMVARDPDILRNKVGAGVAVGGDRIGGQELALLAIHSFYLANKIIPVSGGPFGANLGGTLWSRDLGKEGAQADHEGLKTVYKTVDRLVEFTILLKEYTH